MITRKDDTFVAKIVNMRLTKIFMAVFAPDERLPSTATLGLGSPKKVILNIPAYRIIEAIDFFKVVDYFAMGR